MDTLCCATPHLVTPANGMPLNGSTLNGSTLNGSTVKSAKTNKSKAGGMNVLIRHIVIEMNQCMFDQLNDAAFLEESLVQMTQIMRTDVKSIATHKFKPQGVTSIVIIGASHISIHTWPEHGYADIDLVVCTKNFEMDDLISYLNERFGTEEVRFMEIQRGIFA